MPYGETDRVTPPYTAAQTDTAAYEFIFVVAVLPECVGVSDGPVLITEFSFGRGQCHGLHRCDNVNQPQSLMPAHP